MKFWILLFSFLSSYIFAGNITVNIDNPSFRKIVLAIPDIVPPARYDDETQQLATVATAELRRLMGFTGLFNVMAPGNFNDIVAKLKEQDYLASDLKGVQLDAWKLIAAESLTLGHLARSDKEFTLTLRTIDISQGRVLVGKRYSQVKPNELIKVVRKYADLLLKTYTGKAGIFSSRLVFVGRRSAQAQKQIFISDFDGSNAQAITSKSTPHLSPSWSRNGRYVTFTSYEDGNPDIFLYDTTTQKTRKLAGDKGMNSGANWGPDDKLVVFSGARSGEVDLYVTSPEGPPRKLFIKGPGLNVNPVFSPNGKMMAYASGRFKNPHLFVVNLDWPAPASPRVTGEIRLTYAGWYNVTPSWTPESDKIVFAGYDKEIDRWDIFTVNPDAKNMERLTLRLGDNEYPSFSPNGQNIVYTSNRTDGKDVKSVRQLYIMNRDGSFQRQLMTGLHEAQQAMWGPQIE